MKLAPAMAAARDPAADTEDFHEESPMSVPHLRECLPRRPARVPTYEPRRDRRDAGRRAPPRATLEGWHDQRLVASPCLGPLRINFNYRNVITTAAGYGEKPKRAQYFEGPYELALFRLLETTATIVDYQFQPIQMTWQTSFGTEVHYTTDVMYLTDRGEIVVEEVKATDAYFEHVETHDLLALFEAEISKTGARFIRRSGRRLAEPTFWRTVKDVFDDRRTEYDPADVERVHALILKAGGEAPIGSLIDALSTSSREATAKLHAMMVHRQLAFDLARPTVDDTPVAIPSKPEDPNALRAFLQRFAAEQ